MTRHSTIAVAAMLIASATSVVGAQRKTFISRAGSVYHYLGDTIWMERDTTETRVIYHGDTIVRRMTIDGRLQLEMTLVLADDSARVLSSRKANGELATPTVPPSMPRLIATFERDMLARELDAQPMVERISDRTTVPLSPASPITYPVSPATTIVHARDTVRYIRGCPAGGHTDTTVFLLFGTDSTRRLTAPARTFGQGMAVGLITQMQMSMLRQRVAFPTSAASRELPRIPDRCGTK